MSESALSASTLDRLRVFLLLLLWMGMAGTAAELVLAQHTEDPWQWIPLVLLGGAFFVLIWHAAMRRRAAPLRALRATMVLFVLSGFVGIGLHLKGKMEFKREIDPSLSGWKLFAGSLEAKMPPALAPGVMIQLGLLGLAYAYRHPALGSTDSGKRTAH